MYRGGYLIVDLEGKDLSQRQNYEGLYDRIESTRKAILVTRFVRSDVEYHDFMLPIAVDNTAFVGSVRIGNSNFNFTFFADGSVTVELEPV